METFDEMVQQKFTHGFFLALASLGRRFVRMTSFPSRSYTTFLFISVVPAAVSFQNEHARHPWAKHFEQIIRPCTIVTKYTVAIPPLLVLDLNHQALPAALSMVEATTPTSWPMWEKPSGGNLYLNHFLSGPDIVNT